MTSAEIRKKYLEFFESRGHKIIPSASLVPENDPSVLFTTAGMQQFKPYYIGKKNAEKDFGALNTASVQKCVRTSDIDEVGDESHLTFFEMLGNFSFGGYWKEEAIKYAHEFITSPEWMNLKIDYVSVFEGEENVPADLESEKIWKSIDPSITVKKSGRADNFWGPTGEEGPCGPTTEVYVDGLEVWNIVFNEFYQNADKSLVPLETKGIDTGMGLERLVKVSQKVPTVFDTDLFSDIISTIKQVSKAAFDTKTERIIADHVRTSVFMIADGVVPSNTERGYVLRRLIRRMVGSGGDLIEVADKAIEKYKSIYNIDNKEKILNIIGGEIKKYKRMQESEIKDIDKSVKIALSILHSKHEKRTDKFFRSNSGNLIHLKDLLEYEKLTANEAFYWYTTKGIDIDTLLNFWEKYYKNEIPIEENIKEKFEQLLIKHQEISKAGMEQKFKGGLGGHSEMEIKYHTATHLLRQALENILGEKIEQKGSNITAERLRFDFGFGRKMTDEEKKKVEDLVNQKISENLPVNKVVMNREEAEKTDAAHVFGEKYGDEVSVYYVGNSLDSAWSKEFCGGPHSSNTGELGHFKIVKEESVSAGVRRIKAILE